MLFCDVDSENIHSGSMIERTSSYPTNLTYVSNWLPYDHEHKLVVVPHVGTRHPALRHLLSPPAPPILLLK